MSVMRVKCPHCKASPGQPCVIPGSQQQLRFSMGHPSRVEAAGYSDMSNEVVATYRRSLPENTAMPPVFDSDAADAARQYIAANLENGAVQRPRKDRT